MELKIGDRVKLIKQTEAAAGFHVGDICRITNIENSDDAVFPIKIEMDKHIGYVHKGCLEKINFKKGDIVKIYKNCTIANLNANNSRGCRASTFEFIEYDDYIWDDKHTYTIDEVYEDDVYGIGDYMVNGVCLELVKEKETVKEMTIKQICDALGYEVKIIKEEE